MDDFILFLVHGGGIAFVIGAGMTPDDASRIHETSHPFVKCLLNIHPSLRGGEVTQEIPRQIHAHIRVAGDDWVRAFRRGRTAVGKELKDRLVIQMSARAASQKTHGPLGHAPQVNIRPPGCGNDRLHGVRCLGHHMYIAQLPVEAGNRSDSGERHFGRRHCEAACEEPHDRGQGPFAPAPRFVRIAIIPHREFL